MPSKYTKDLVQRLRTLPLEQAEKLLDERLQLAYRNGRGDGFASCAEKVSEAAGRLLAFDFSEND